MRKRNLLALGLLTTLLPCSWVAAEQVNVREEDINGVPHRVTTRIVKRPMSETKIVEREQEIYREEYTTDFQETSRIVQTPVTHRWMAEEEIVSRVALQPLDGSGSAGSLARKPSIGGTKLESDPPKSGSSSARRY